MSTKAQRREKSKKAPRYCWERKGSPVKHADNSRQKLSISMRVIGGSLLEEIEFPVKFFGVEQ